MKTKFVLAGLAAVLVAGCQTQGGSGNVKKVADKPALLEFFVMSQCPYGVQVMKAVGPVIDKLGPNLDFKVNYIGSKDPNGFTSMHGPNEVTGDIVQLCAAQIAPTKYVKMIECQYKNPHEVATNWQSCAPEAGVDVARLKSCIEGDQGKKLLEASFDASAQRHATGSPTIFLNGQPYRGGRNTDDFLRAVCNSYTGTKPEACTNIPVPARVTAIFFSDKRCPKCDISPLEGRLRMQLPGLEVKNVDYMSDEGKELYAELQKDSPEFKNLPAILFDSSLDKDANGKKGLERWLHPIGKYQSLALGGSFDPTAEICDNKVDDDGNGKVDCDDPGCKEDLICRPEMPKTLGLFVMSQCPYGAKAVTAMKEVLGNFKGNLALSVHFIGSLRNGEPYSMHGPAEVEEDLRQVCAVKHYPKDHKFMDYLECRAANPRDPKWEACTGQNGISAAVIKKCVDTEGKKLLAKEFELADSLGISASPTFLANNKYKFGGIDAETIKTNYCKHNQGLAGCAASLSQDKQVNGSCGQ